MNGLEYLARAYVRAGETFTPICSDCLRIRTPKGDWVEGELTGERTDGVCPECEARALAKLAPPTAGAPVSHTGAPAPLLVVARCH